MNINNLKNVCFIAHNPISMNSIAITLALRKIIKMKYILKVLENYENYEVLCQTTSSSMNDSKFHLRHHNLSSWK